MRWCWPILFALLVGCNPTRKVLEDYERNLRGGSFVAAAEVVESKANKKNGDELLWRLMTGNARLLSGESEKAIEQFDLAEDIFAKNDNASVFSATTREAYSMLSNDMAFAYNGTGQDRIFCCMYKAIDYALHQRNNAARTEFNRAYEHQENWLFERRRDIVAADKALEKDARKYAKDKNLADDNYGDSANLALRNPEFAAKFAKIYGFSPQSSANLRDLAVGEYSNAYLSHLCGVFRWLNGDNGRDFIRDAVRYNGGCSVIQNDLKDASSGKIPTDSVWIFVEDGLCPYREEVRFDLPLGVFGGIGSYVPYVGIALPRLVFRGVGANSYVATAGGQSYPLEVLQNVDVLLQTEFKVYMRGAVRREITRCLVKAASQAALGIAAHNTKDSNARLALYLAQAAVVSWSAATTIADLRCWTGLPKRVLVQRIQRPDDGKIVLTADFQSLAMEVPAGNSIIWIRKVAPESPLVLKMVNNMKQ